MTQMAKMDLLIMDDWGLAPMGRAERHDLLEIMEERHAARSTIITSQLPVERWHEYINDPTIADAVLDRVVHNAYKIALKGESLRKSSGRFEWLGAHDTAQGRRGAGARK